MTARLLTSVPAALASAFATGFGGVIGAAAIVILLVWASVNALRDAVSDFIGYARLYRRDDDDLAESPEFSDPRPASLLSDSIKAQGGTECHRH